MKLTVVLTGCFILLVGAGAAYAETVSGALQAAIKEGVPRAQASAVVARARAAGIGDRNITDMIQVLVSARHDDVPVGAVSGKIMEGISKHVAPGAIVSTAVRLEQAYVTANGISSGMDLREPAGSEFKQAMATALFNGIPKEDLVDLYHTAPGAGQSYYVIGTVSLTSLVASGFGKDKSLSFMKKAFAEHRSAGTIEHETMQMMEQGAGSATDMRMDRPRMPGGPQDRMPGNQNMHMQDMNMPGHGR
jgi:hypothetical protein